MSSQNKQEKKIIDEKIAKVREVVRTNFSNNDIILALHHFELDVEKTIHAFLQGGHKEALGDWEQTATSASKKNKQKKNKLAAKNETNSTNTVVKPKIQTNGISNGYNLTNISQSIVNNGASSLLNDQLSTASSYLESFHPSAAKPKVVEHTGIIKQTPPVSAEEAVRFQALDSESKLKAIQSQTEGLKNYAAELDKLQNVLSGELSLSQSNVLSSIQEIKQVLAERERQLCSELSRCRDEALEFFASRRAKLNELNKKVKTVKGKDSNNNLYNELKAFNAEKAADQQVAYVTRFIFDTSKVFNDIADFGNVIPLNASSNVRSANNHHNLKQPNGSSVLNNNDNNNNLTKVINNENRTINGHASPDHSSVVSSLGEDFSDLSQVSPNAQKGKNIAQLDNNGIVMQSDSLSADQLVDIQKRIEEALRLQGIDPSVLSEIGTNTVAPRRRLPPGAKKNVNNNRANHNSNQNQKSKTKISILE